MKKVINGILVVEGKSDVSYLSNYIDAEFVITNGSDVPMSTISYLKEASKTKDVIVLTDPDFPGKQIRNVLDNEIPGLKHCFVSKEKSIKHGKVGVAECDIDEVLKALENSFTSKKEIKGNLTASDLYFLGLSGSDNSLELRNKISDKYHLGYNNTKSLLNRLNSLGISKEELKEVINNG